MTSDPTPTAGDPAISPAGFTTDDRTANPGGLNPVGDPSTVEVVRSEEQLRVGTRTTVRERVRLRKRVVTEEVTRTVTVSREVLDVEQLPAESAGEGAAAFLDSTSPAELDLVLHEERVVVTTEIVPVERVRVRVERITDQVEVAEVVRREQVEVSPPTAPGTVSR